MKQQLINMLTLQDKMNTKVHADWRSQNYAWYRAIWTECAELLDHHGWKWWKAQTPDLPQIQLEIVDIWHFGLSILIVNNNDIQAISEEICEQWSLEQPSTTFPEAIESLAEHTLRTKHFSIPLFCKLMSLADMDQDELYRQYIGKNVLNFFRQDNGYKEGSYIKVWNGKEDNEHLAEVIQIVDPTASDFQQQVYDQLSNRYPTI
ncbi:dUTP diphosphatase [Gammaproteobacteria bacterium 45_16_T64]|nr:dUTP diphosphatase [Gammaproteobacteria bacterium 45_16_T64]